MAQNPREACLEVKSASRPIDRIHLVTGRVIHSVHSGSINLGGLARVRETGHEFPNINNVPIACKYKTHVLASWKRKWTDYWY